MNPDQRASFAHIAPFAAYVGVMAISRAAGLSPVVDFSLRVAAAGLLILLFSRPYLDVRPSRPAGSILLGVAVFVIWVGPDLLLGYRHSWLFDNPLVGKAATSVPPALRHNAPWIALRAASCFLLVPILEELFWRGWLMRWLIRPKFMEVKFGAYQRAAFWIVAVLFASEHGSYWEVGLVAGVLYNWWAVRTGRLADCILAHAVTNAALSAFVLIADRWEYWL